MAATRVLEWIGMFQGLGGILDIYTASTVTGNNNHGDGGWGGGGRFGGLIKVGPL